VGSTWETKGAGEVGSCARTPHLSPRCKGPMANESERNEEEEWERRTC